MSSVYSSRAGGVGASSMQAGPGPTQTPLSRSQYRPTQQQLIPSLLPPSSSSTTSSSALSVIDGVDVGSFMQAAQLVEGELSYDEKRSDGLDQLDTRDQGHYHYQKEQLTLARQMALPQAILDQYDAVECQSFVGLLPAIHRAYLTIDNKLFLWNYENGTDFYAYTDLQQIIVSVTLCTPKPGIFTTAIQHLLLLTTPVEILIFALSFSDPNDTQSSALTLYPTSFNIPSDNVTMLQCVCTSLGRILMGGKDGHLYEARYSATDRWWGWKPKMQKIRHSSLSTLHYLPTPLTTLIPSFIWKHTEDSIEHMALDEQRTPALLYTVNTSNTIRVWSIGRRDDSAVNLLHTNTVVWEQCRQCLSNLHPNCSEDWNNKAEFSIVGLSIVPKTESEKIVCVAITNHGHRIYFSLYDTPYSYGYASTSSPNLRVRFVRLCPPGLTEPEVPRPVGRALMMYRPATQAFEPAYKRGVSPSAVHTAWQSSGVLILADSMATTAGDALVAITRDYTPNTNKLIEAVDCQTLTAKIADMSEVPTRTYLSPLSSSLYARGQDQPLVGLNEFAIQHATPARSFLVLTPTGVLSYIKPRALDELCTLLLQRRKSLDDQELQAFFQRYGWKEGGAMLLVIACSLPATLALIGEGVEERRNGAVLMQSPHKYQRPLVNDESLIKQAKQGFFRYGLNAMPTASSQLPTTVPMLGSVSSSTQQLTSMYALPAYAPALPVSPMASALLLFASRVLRPVWDWTLFTPVTTTTAATSSTQPTFSSSSLSSSLPTSTSTSAAALALRRITLRWTSNQLVEITGWIERLLSFIEEHQRLLYRMREDVEIITQLSALLSLTLELLSFLYLLSIQSRTIAASPLGDETNAQQQQQQQQQLSRYMTRLLATVSDHDASYLRETKFYDVLTTHEGYMVMKALMHATAKLQTQVSSTTPNGRLPAGVLMNGHSAAASAAAATAATTAPYTTDSEQLMLRLHQACPSFFGQSDLLYYKAQECLKLVQQQQQQYNAGVGSLVYHQIYDDSAQRGLLDEALHHYRVAARSPSFAINDVAAALTAVGCYTGIVELALHRAELINRREVVMSRHQQTLQPQPQQQQQQQQQQQGTPSDEERQWRETEKQRCYDVVLDTLTTVFLSPSPSSSSSLILTTDPESLRTQLLSLCLSSPDTDFHACLYTWYIKHDLKEQLFAIQSHELLQFLSSHEEYAGLLKDYYLRHNMYGPAAILLHELAYKPNPNARAATAATSASPSSSSILPPPLSTSSSTTSTSSVISYSLSDRIGFLSRALACARTCIDSGESITGHHDQDSDLLFLIKDRLEIAKIQGKIHTRLSLLLNQPSSSQTQQQEPSLDATLSTLDSELLDLEALYNIAQQWKLWEINLSIVYFSHEYEQEAVIHALWQNILRQEISVAKQQHMDWFPAVQQKIHELVSMYHDAIAMIPVSFIVRELEIDAVKWRDKRAMEQPEIMTTTRNLTGGRGMNNNVDMPVLPDDCVSVLLYRAGLDLSRLLAAYEQLVSERRGGAAGSRMDGGKEELDVLSVYRSITALLTILAEQQKQSGISNRPFTRQTRAMTTAAATPTRSITQLLNKTLAALRATQPSPHTEDLTRQLNAIQQRIIHHH